MSVVQQHSWGDMNVCRCTSPRVTRIDDTAALRDTDAMTRTMRYTERLSFLIGTQVGAN